MNPSITRLPQCTGIFRPDPITHAPECSTPAAPINGYRGYLCPGDNDAACTRGRQVAHAVRAGHIADFERSPDYCTRHGESDADQMVHVSTFDIIRGMIYMTYYANTQTAAEDHHHQEARLAFCPTDHPEQLTVLTLQKVGDLLDSRRIDALYDTIFLYKGGNELYLMWTASADGMYYRFYCIYDIEAHTLGPIRPNRFRVGTTEADFSIRGITAALTANGLPHKTMFTDIGIMQKLTSREESGETWYYTGAYSGFFNCIIKSRDLITWEYVATPDFINLSLWENAVYVRGSRCYYFVRQTDCQQGFLTYYDLDAHTWATPCLIRDAQSRSDFFVYRDTLYLVHAPLNREGFGVVRINEQALEQSEPVFVADLGESCFYPFVRVWEDCAYISYTVDRKHIRLAQFDLRHALGPAESEAQE